MGFGAADVGFGAANVGFGAPNVGFGAANVGFGATDVGIGGQFSKLWGLEVGNVGLMAAERSHPRYRLPPLITLLIKSSKCLLRILISGFRLMLRRTGLASTLISLRFTGTLGLGT